MAYESVNSQWPDGTREGRDIKPTPQEAITAVKLLYRFAMKRKCPFRVIATSGNRRGGIKGGTWKINPDRWNGGWHEVVHHVSHLCAWRLHPGIKSHSTQHAFLEREMIAHVVKSGWLDGKLRRNAEPKPKPDPKQVRYQRALASIKRWESKRKRADTALRKLRKTVKYYEARVG